MTTIAKVSTELRQLNQISPYIELFTLDCAFIGGSVYHFTPNVDAVAGPIKFNGITYLPIPIETSGWELSATGTQARPTLTVSNVNGTLLGAVITLGDLVNARVQRTRTFAKFLDGQPTADPTAFVDPMDVYFIYQKTLQNKNVISWQLASPVEAFGQMLPGRQFLKDGTNGFPGISRYRGAQ